METLSSRYAQALLEIALEEKKNEAYRNEIKELLESFEQSEDLLNVLRSAFISKEEKKQLFNELLKEEKFPKITYFIQVIIDNSRERYMLDIFKEFIRLSNQEDNIVEGLVYSTTKLSKSEMDKVTKAMEEKLQKKVYLRNRLDGSLIGGVKVIVDNYVFDGSIKNKLKQLKQQLEKGA